ncbi:MAG TPA: hypothetical protein VKY85_03045 [Candidatus Angelobacter sp.]|nr:hypothetical protein [Candidatus Angelobacter sp.]
MLPNAGQLISDFTRVSAIAGMPIKEHEIRHEFLRAPHQSPRLPKESYALYVFSLTCEELVVLKVGKAGPNSAARFESQHYLPRSCNSNLGKSIVAGGSHWSKLGISAIEEDTVGEWLRSNTDRDHFFLNCGPSIVFLINLFEAFLQCKLRPLFEG